MNSFFVENRELKLNQEIELNEIEHNHLSKVLRMKKGDLVQIYANDENVYLAEIVEISKKQTKLLIKEIKKSTTNPKTRVDLFTALLKGDKFEFLITKLTELGISKLIPFESEFSIGKSTGDKSARYNQIAKDACKQCKRSKLIEISQALTFEQMLLSLKDYDLVLFAFEKEINKSLNQILREVETKCKIALIVGSEGGFSEKEAEKIKNKGGVSVSLGSRILRAETASLMLSSIVLNFLGEYE